MEKRVIAVFDFDGTLTKKDSFIEFIRFVYGSRKLYMGLMMNIFLILAFKLHLYSNGLAKQKLFSYFFRGMEYDTFCKYGEEFVPKLDAMLNPKGVQFLEHHQKQRHKIVIVSASMQEWIKPWCVKHNLSNFIGTQAKVSDESLLTGEFASDNCYGPEKLRRFLEVEPDRGSYILYAYGDSRGDREMIEFADYGTYI